ncbi:16S rRNA (guanine(527)-N(7))-methyltransferase RsmG [Caldisericum exile]|uniref:Ribosomal RNA small subunit methyltransferase G n=1 Tax=Caldisericum exile (strain DSM 21853 / NBRC 104410 / AZM16c01) TaxID=511051 RepID=A0A7U6GFI2_CALEA|nr:16S rRNA (guanine(527)-N(7))-methyltransferase RsmG [Caldisericum exile]BAL81436.1 ribosomal RNA small subunit methyltransferase G [Caldisericum exile AZM16c01]
MEIIPSYGFYQYLKLLSNAPKRVVLMSPKDNLDVLYKKHIDEAKLYLPYIGDSMEVLDLGSGAGFPGIPLAIMKPQSQFYLLDKRKTHTDFLRNVITILNLTNVKVINLDAELLKRKNLTFEVVVARAVNRIDVILSWIKDNLKSNGTVVLGKKKDIENELKTIKSPFHLKELIETSFGYLVVIKKL